MILPAAQNCVEFGPCILVLGSRYFIYFWGAPPSTVVPPGLKLQARSNEPETCHAAEDLGASRPDHTGVLLRVHPYPK